MLSACISFPLILSHHFLLIETFFVTFWELAGFGFCFFVRFFFWAGAGGSSGGASQDFLISFSKLSQHISRFQASKTSLKKETVAIPFQWKELTKHVVGHRHLIPTQTEHMAHFNLTCSNNKRSCRSDSPIHLLRHSAPFLIKKATLMWPWLHSLASARASSVFPVPGGP